MKFQKIKFFLFYLLLSISILKAQFNIPEPPKKIYPVNDFAKKLTEEQIDFLNQKLIKYSHFTSIEILIIIIKSLNGEDPNFIGANWGEKWKIGQKGKNNGIVFLIDVKSKKLAIQTGYGIEPYLTDALSKRIIEKQIKPLIQEGNYYKAIDEGLTAIFKTLKNTYKNKNIVHKKNNLQNYIFYIISAVFIILFFRSGNKNNNRKDPYYNNDSFTLSNIGRWGYGNLNSSNDNEWDNNLGSGGDFGGGGASGSW